MPSAATAPVQPYHGQKRLHGRRKKKVAALLVIGEKFINKRMDEEHYRGDISGII